MNENNVRLFLYGYAIKRMADNPYLDASVTADFLQHAIDAAEQCVRNRTAKVTRPLCTYGGCCHCEEFMKLEIPV